MPRVKKTKIYASNGENGEEIQLDPLFYCKDQENRKVIVAGFSVGSEKYTIPFLMPQDIEKNENKSIKPIQRKQRFTHWRKKYEVKDLTFQKELEPLGYNYNIRIETGIIKKIWLFLCHIFDIVRGKLKKVRQKNPKVYDFVAKTTGFVFEAVVAVIGFVSGLSAGWITVAVCLLYALFMAFQLGSERNRSDRLIKENNENHEKKIKQIEKERDDSIKTITDEAKKQEEHRYNELIREKTELARIEHLAAHNIKVCVTDMKRMSDRMDRLDKLAEFLKKCADSLENQLSHYYEKEICASFKLACSETTIRTYTRGEKNITNRKINGVPRREDPKEISRNTAYNHIYNEECDSFVCGDLRNTKFQCERDNWQEFFLATIVIPIRWSIPHENRIKIGGMICVDCKDPIPEWDRRSFGYHLVAFYADLLFIALQEIAS